SVVVLDDDTPHRADKPTIQVQFLRLGLAVDDERHVVPAAVIDDSSRGDLVDASVPHLAVQPAVRTDVQCRKPAAIGARIRGTNGRLPEDDAATPGLEPGLDRLGPLVGSNQVIGQADVARPIELELAVWGGCVTAVGKDRVPQNPVVDRVSRYRW